MNDAFSPTEKCRVTRKKLVMVSFLVQITTALLKKQPFRYKNNNMKHPTTIILCNNLSLITELVLDF